MLPYLLHSNGNPFSSQSSNINHGSSGFTYYSSSPASHPPPQPHNPHNIMLFPSSNHTQSHNHNHAFNMHNPTQLHNYNLLMNAGNHGIHGLAKLQKKKTDNGKARRVLEEGLKREGEYTMDHFVRDVVSAFGLEGVMTIRKEGRCDGEVEEGNFDSEVAGEGKSDQAKKGGWRVMRMKKCWSGLKTRS